MWKHQSLPCCAHSQHRRIIKWMSEKELTILMQAANGLFAGHLWRWRGPLSSTCKLCGETEETLLHLWGECPTHELERTQLRTPGVGWPRPFHHQILNFSVHEKIRGLMEANSDLLGYGSRWPSFANWGWGWGFPPPSSKQRVYNTPKAPTDHRRRWSQSGFAFNKIIT